MLGGGLDVVGYYGNSGSAVSAIPRLADIHPAYNVLILKFATIDASGNATIDLQGPYEKNLTGLAADVQAWRGAADAWGRPRRALVSIGGQNGRWPGGLPAATVLSGLEALFAQLGGLDGLDVDLESGSLSAAASLVPVVDALTKQGMTVTAAPEAAQSSLDAYAALLPHLSWVHPQFYNNGPNAVTTPYVPPPSLWPTPWTVHDWQAESGGQAFWAGVLTAIANHSGVAAAAQGMLIPATAAAAGSYNNWDIDKLAAQVATARIARVGCWAVAYDHTQAWKFAATFAGALDRRVE